MTTITIEEARKLDDSIKISPFYANYIEGILATEDEIEKRISEIAQEIFEFYQERPYVIFVVLKGSFYFFSSLHKYLQKLYCSGKYSNYIHAEFIKIKSYHNDGSTGKVDIMFSGYENLEGKEVLVLEDIIDTGSTMHNFKEELLNKMKVKDVKIATLIDKVKCRKPGIEVKGDFTGFNIEFSPFVIGYGLDYNEHFRDLNLICTINKEGIERFKI